MSIDRPIHFHAWMSATTTIVQVVLPSQAMSMFCPVTALRMSLSAPSGRHGLEDVADGQGRHDHGHEERHAQRAVRPGVPLEQ